MGGEMEGRLGDMGRPGEVGANWWAATDRHPPTEPQDPPLPALKPHPRFQSSLNSRSHILL